MGRTHSFIEGITPGPANLASLNASLHYGKTSALRQWRGLFTGCFLSFTGPICNLCWLFAGVRLQSLFRKHWRLLNLLMALSLLLCALSLFL
jgi:threonine/homoserine/homoserine lactone efflux protein